MTTGSWIRNLFASRTPRTLCKAPAGSQLSLEMLEDRLAPANFTVSALADNTVADSQLTLREAVCSGTTTATPRSPWVAP